MIYSFLLNRFQLSRLNNWINADGEIFIIYTRSDLSEEIGISYRKAIEAVKELTASCLIWERRCGRGDANQIYLARVELNEEDALRHKSAPFAERAVDSRHTDIAVQENEEIGSYKGDTEYFMESRAAILAVLDSDSMRRDGDDESNFPGDALSQDMQKRYINNSENGMSRASETAVQDMPKPHSSNTYMINTDKRDIDNSQSVRHAYARESLDRLTDDSEGLSQILKNCDLWTFSPETAKVFENAIERLWYTTSYKICGAALPQAKVRSHLYELDNIRLQDAQQKLSANTERQIKNSTAYVMAVIFNSIWEVESDVMADPYLNSLRSGLEGGGP